MTLNKRGRYECSSCGSSDGLAYYQDGSYCFSCSKTKKEKQRDSSFKDNVQKNDAINRVRLPLDLTRKLPKEPMEWLQSYSLYDDILPFCEWSPTTKYLYIHLVNHDFWQARNFNTYGPKWLSKSGIKPIALIFGVHDTLHGGPLILVEDILSAYKLSFTGKVTCPLFGTIAKPEIYKYCKDRNVIIWLDCDALDKAQTIQNQLASIAKSVRIVRTEKDPKCYSPKTINEILE